MEEADIPMHRYVDEPEEVDDDWEMLHPEDGKFKGIALAADRRTGRIVYASTKRCGAADLWTTMPSLSDFKESLVVLDLHRSKYIRELHGSVCDLASLQRLLLTRCSNLRFLPPATGNLRNLTELNLFDSHQLSELPQSIGDLIR